MWIGWEHPKGDTLETLQKDRVDSLLRIADLERRVEIAEQSACLKENAIADLMKPRRQKSGRKKSEGGAQLIAKIDDFQKTEEKLTSKLKQKEEQRYQATQQVLALREELSSSRHHIEKLQQRYKETVDANQKIEGEMKQLLEITPEDIPEDVDVRVLVSQLRARLSMFERENQQVKVHTKQQSRQIQIMKQEQEGIELHEGYVESLKGTCEDLEGHNRALADQLRRIKEENQQLRSKVEAEQAQAMTYKLDFDEERKDRAEAHSRYADLVAELKKDHVQEISQITKNLELHKGSLEDVEGVKFALDKELCDWQAEALQSREELQAKTSQVKAYKKQVDQLKEKSKQEKQQISDLSENVKSLLEELSTTRKSLPKKSDLPPSPASKGKSKTTEHKKKSTGELPSPCGGFEQQLAKAEQLIDILQTENECLREAKRKSLLAEKALKEANENLTDKVENLERNLKDLRVCIKKESEAGELGKGCDKSPSAVENPILESDHPLRAKDLSAPPPPPISNTLVAASPSYPPRKQADQLKKYAEKQNNQNNRDGHIQANIEKSTKFCEALEGGLVDYQVLVKRLQDGLAAFQTDHEVLRKVTEERDCLLKEIEYVRSDRDHLLMKTAGQREIIATIQHELKIKEDNCTRLAKETERVRVDLQLECAKLLTSLKQCREESEQNIAEVRGRCEQETNGRIQQERQAQRVFKQLDRRVKELVMLSPSKGRKFVESLQTYRQEVKAFTVNSKTPIQYSDGNRIGSGSFGSVYEVNLNGTPCIAKRLHDILMGRGKQENVALEDKQACHEKFCRECVLMSRAEHANVVKFIGVHFGKNEFDLTLFMERLHTDLEVYLGSTPDVPLLTKVSILHDVSCGLLYLHEECSIIHRDLTAANILLTADNRAKIADLGVSRIFNRTFLQLSKIPGTLPYMPPEALKDGAIYDESLDVFSFGVLTLCVGIQMSPDLSWDHVPDDVHSKGEQEIFKRKMWIEMMEQKQPEISSLVLWCLSDDPKSRPSTYCVNFILQEMKHDL